METCKDKSLTSGLDFLSQRQFLLSSLFLALVLIPTEDSSSPSSSFPN